MKMYSKYFAVGMLELLLFGCTPPQPETSATDSTLHAQQKSSNEAKQAEPTPDLGKIVSLRSYDFSAYFDRNKPRITVGDLISLYSVKKERNKLEFSSEIPNIQGKYVYNGMFWNLPTLDVSGKKIIQPVTNGYIWTPRSETAGGVNLATMGKVSEASGFDFNAFKEHPAVIQFRNGYGVNLYGAVILRGAIIQAGSGNTYVTSNGVKLYGRVIEERIEGDVRMLRETVLE